MEKSTETKFRRPGESAPAMRIATARPIGNSLTAFKFPIKPDPNVSATYGERKINLISRKKFVNRITQNPANDFVGSLKLF